MSWRPAGIRSGRGGRGRLALLLVGLLVLALFAAARLLREQPARPPLALLVVWDSVDVEALAPYGGPAGRTPALAALARSSVVYERHVPCVDTTAAAAASLLTGLRPRHHGVGAIAPGARRRLPDAVPTLGEAFRAAGWRTLGAVSLLHLDPESGLARGFDLYDAPPGEPRRDVRPAAETLTALLPALEQALAGDAPVFCFLHLAETRAPDLGHAPGAARWLADEAGALVADDPELAARVAAAARGDAAALDELRATYARRRGDPLRAALERAFHDAALARMDDALRALLERAAAHGRDPLVVVTGGPAGGPPFDPAPPEPGARATRLTAPLVLRLPGGRTRGSARVATQDLDVAPTLLAACGLPPLARCDGRDLVAPLLGGLAPPARVPLVECGRFAVRAAVGARAVLASSPAAPRAVLPRAAAGAPPGTEQQDADERAALEQALRAMPPLGRLRVRAGSGARAWALAVGGPLERTLVAAGEEQTFERSSRLDPPADGRLPFELRTVDGRAAVELRFRDDAGGIGGDLAARVGGRALAELDLTLLRAPGPPWPTDEAGLPAPAAATVADAPGGWSTVAVGAEGGGAARAVVEWIPSDPQAALERVRAASGSRVARHPRRAGAVVVSGPAPLRFEVGRDPRGRFALAFFVDGARVAAGEIRLRQLDGGWRRYCGPGETAILLSAAAWDDPELYTPPSEPLPDAPTIELLDPPPPGPPDPALDAAAIERRLLLSRTD